MAKEIEAKILKKIDEVSAIAQISRLVVHKIYGKRLKRHKKVYVHNILEAKVGDWVLLEQTRPLSKLKRWKVRKIVKSF